MKQALLTFLNSLIDLENEFKKRKIISGKDLKYQADLDGFYIMLDGTKELVSQIPDEMKLTYVGTSRDTTLNTYAFSDSFVINVNYFCFETTW